MRTLIKRILPLVMLHLALMACAHATNNASTPSPVPMPTPVIPGSPTRWVNVKAYSVLGGGADESANLQLAATAAIGRVLYFPNVSNETYVFNNLNVGAGTTVIADAGVTLKMKAQTTTAYPLFNVTGAHVTFLNLNIDGDKSNQSTRGISNYSECECYSNAGLGGAGSAFRAGIKADALVNRGVTDLRVEGCTFTNMFGSSVVTVGVDRPTVTNNTTTDSWRAMADLGGGNAAGTAWSRDAIVTNNRAINITRYNAFLLSGYDGAVFSGNTLRNVDRSMKIEGGRSITVSNNKFIDVVTLECAKGCNSQVGSAIQITSTTNSCGYLKADGVTPECGTRDVVISDNTFSRVPSALGLQTQAGGLENIIFDHNIIHRTTSTLGEVVRISQDTVAYVPEHIKITNNLATDVYSRFVNMAAGNYVTIHHNEARGQSKTPAGGGNEGIFIGPNGGLKEIKSLTISNNELSNFSTFSGAISVYDNADSSVTYTNLQVKGNNVDQGSANLALLMSKNTVGAAARDYVAAGSSISGNTFIGTISVYQSNVFWSPDNRVTGTGYDSSVALGQDLVLGQMVFQGSQAIDLPSLTSDCDTFTIPVRGALTTDKNVTVSADATGAGFKQVFSGHVSAKDVVTVRRCAVAGGAAVDPPAATYTATIIRAIN